MAESRGYLLPSGDAFTDDYFCCFVYVPAHEEYRRAFFGALDYLGTWIAWERDDEKRGRDAALAWKYANELTRECWEMGTCDSMVELLTDIRSILQAQKCCGGDTYVTYNNNPVVTTTIQPGVGDYPTTWGEDTTIESWDDWELYVCYHAHEFVDALIDTAENFDLITSAAGWYLEFVGWAFTRLAFLFPIFVPAQWNVNWLRSILDGIIFVFPDLNFANLATRFESARDDIVCAIMLDDDISAAVEEAVDNELLWNTLYQFVEYDNLKATIYTGEAEGIGYLPPNQREDCSCVEPDALCGPLANCHWREGATEWTLQGGIIWQDSDYVEDGFHIDGNLWTNTAPTGQDAISDGFHWDGGLLRISVLASSGITGTIAYQNTYVIVRVKRVSDDVQVQSLATTHGGGNGVWSIDQDTTVIAVPGDDYYITITIDGAGGYPQRRVDYVGLDSPGS